VAAWVSCLGTAEPLDAVAARLERHGLDVEETEVHDGPLAELFDRVEARLRMACAAPTNLPGLVAEEVERGLELARIAQQTVVACHLGYGVVIARLP